MILMLTKQVTDVSSERVPWGILQVWSKYVRIGRNFCGEMLGMDDS